MRSLKNTIITLCMIIFAMVAITVGTTFACVDLKENDADAASTTIYLYVQRETGYKTGVYEASGFTAADVLTSIKVIDGNNMGYNYGTVAGSEYGVSMSVTTETTVFAYGFTFEVMTKPGYTFNASKTGSGGLTANPSSGYTLTNNRATIYLDRTAQAEGTTYWNESSEIQALVSASKNENQWAGSGTELNPYRISSATDLAWFAYMVNLRASNSGVAYKNRYFKQTCDIDLSKYWWKPIGYDTSSVLVFSGTYDGGGYKITGLFTPEVPSGSTRYQQALFAYVGNGAIIKNVGIENSIIQGSNYVGAIVGEIYQGATITSCYNKGTIKGLGNMGGLIGDATSGTTYVNDCYNYGEIKSKGSAGGLIGGTKNVYITHCYNFGNVSTELSTGVIGGIVCSSYDNTGITDCVNYCDLNAPSSGSPTKGEIVAQVRAGTLTLNHCYYSGMYVAIGSGSYTGTAIELGGDREISEESWYTDSSNWNTPWDFTNTWIWKNSYPDLRVFYPTTLTINPNGGMFSGSPNTVSYGQHIGETRTLPVPTREGYTFKGWRVQSGNAGTLGNLGKKVSDYESFFIEGNSVGVYVYGGNTTLTRESASLQQSPFNTHVLKISTTGECTFENRNGFTFNTQTYADAEFIAIFEAKIPVGYRLYRASNQCGGTNWDGIESGWFTPCDGTGDWETYAYYTKCWPSSTGGEYSTTNFFYLYGPAGTAENPVNWYLSQASVYDCTGMNLNTGSFVSRLSEETTYTYGTSDTTLVAMWETDVWTRHAADSYAGGDGSAENPYQIANASQLAKLAKDSIGKDYDTNYYILTSNIDLSGHEWMAIGNKEYYFRGVFDGRYHVISNMKNTIIENGDGALFGVIGYNYSGLVKNLIIDKANMTKGNNVGAIAGLIDSQGMVENCIVRNSILNSNNYYAGGITGYLWNSRINNCQVINSTISGRYAGAVFGYEGGTGSNTVTNNGAYGNTITGTAGGALFGNYNTNAIMNFNGSYAHGTVNGTATKIMYGNQNAWGAWTYNTSINEGYPVQSGIFWIGGQSGSANVYNYLKNTLGFTVAN